jgi:hypothetical protein
MPRKYYKDNQIDIIEYRTWLERLKNDIPGID